MALNCSDCRTLRNCINLLSAKRFSVVSPLRCAGGRVAVTLLPSVSVPGDLSVLKSESCPAQQAGPCSLRANQKETVLRGPVAEA